MKTKHTRKIIVFSLMVFAGSLVLASCGKDSGYNYAKHNKRSNKSHKSHSKLPSSHTGVGFNNSSGHGH
ncbi:MAG: hypothetical protein HRT72_10055 [Flavobacteriales bacterium]|nr:hypothetical protein [Flavobacteriales bacterium]